MLRWALIFFVISVIAGIFGFTGIAAGAAAIAKVFFVIAMSLSVVLLVSGLIVGRAVTGR